MSDDGSFADVGRGFVAGGGGWVGEGGRRRNDREDLARPSRSPGFREEEGDSSAGSAGSLKYREELASVEGEEGVSHSRDGSFADYQGEWEGGVGSGGGGREETEVGGLGGGEEDDIVRILRNRMLQVLAFLNLFLSLSLSLSSPVSPGGLSIQFCLGCSGLS